MDIDKTKLHVTLLKSGAALTCDQVVDDFIPETFLETVESGWISDESSFGPIYLTSLSKMLDVNRRDPSALEAGLLIIGSASNGDPFVLDLNSDSGEVGYLSHERFWNGGGVDSYVKLSDSLIDCLELSLTDESFPIDWYQASGID
ncbi:MAG: hypothetical protein AAFX93_11175 [Verrucomicrobiota bacterium]